MKKKEPITIQIIQVICDSVSNNTIYNLMKDYEKPKYVLLSIQMLLLQMECVIWHIFMNIFNWETIINYIRRNIVVNFKQKMLIPDYI